LPLPATHGLRLLGLLRLVPLVPLRRQVSMRLS
jgi:hypothetical protein